MIEKDNPCKRDCPDRTSSCHGTCSLYAKYYSRRRDKNKHDLVILSSIPSTRENMVFKKSSMHNNIGSFKKPDKTRRR